MAAEAVAAGDPAKQHGELLDHQQVAFLCAAWVAAWLALHFLSTRPLQAIQAVGLPRDVYSRRLCRSQVYCVLAVLGAAHLLKRCERVPEDLLEDFTLEHQMLFCMAVGHWTVSIWEDHQGRMFLGRGLDRRLMRGFRDPTKFLARAYTLHHLVAVAGFAALLWLRSCAGIGTFGLLFELPIVMTNRRDIACHGSPTPAWLKERAGVLFHWRCTYILFMLGRGGPIATYFYSIAFWREHLDKLSGAAQLTYHGLALFFAVLSYGFLFLMESWTRRDHQAAGRGSAAEEVEPEDDAPDTEEATNDGPVNPEAARLTEVLPDVVETMTGEGDSRLWVAIDGIAYDVTDFLKEHPGGEQVFRKWAGQDASEAFHGVRHSPKAKAQMLRYMVGQIWRPKLKYRLFEHVEDEWPMFEIIFQSMLSLAALAFLLDRVLLQLPWAATAPAGAAAGASPGPAAVGLLDLLLPSLLLATTTGVIGTLLSFTQSAAKGKAQTPISSEDHAFALAIVGLHVGILAGIRGAPASLAPTGLEVGAAALLAAEMWLEVPATRDEPDRFYGVWGATLAVLWSWASRVRRSAALATSSLEDGTGLATPLGSSLEGLLEPMLLAAFIAASVSVIVRRVGRNAQTNGVAVREELARRVFRGWRLLMLYAGAGAFAVTLASPAANLQLAALLARPQGLVMSLLLSGVMCCLTVGGILSTTFKCTATFASRCCAFGMALAAALLSIFGGGPGGAAWPRFLSFVGLMTHLFWLGARNRIRLHEAAAAGRFSEVPHHIIGAQALWDRFRVTLGTIIWRVTVLKWQEVCNACLPHELCVYAGETVFPKFGTPGKDMHLGVAAHFAPHKSQGQKKRMPNYFVCNVGQIYKNSLEDMQRTMNNLIDVWGEFQQPDMKGLVANLVAVFPDVEDQKVAKEINLSAWETAKDAHDWYVRSPGHKQAVYQHSSGLLRTFGNLLASLEPKTAIRHQDRCRNCHRVVEAKEPGMLAPSRCGVCGGGTFQYPLF